MSGGELTRGTFWCHTERAEQNASVGSDLQPARDVSVLRSSVAFMLGERPQSEPPRLGSFPARKCVPSIACPRFSVPAGVAVIRDQRRHDPEQRLPRTCPEAINHIGCKRRPLRPPKQQATPKIFWVGFCRSSNVELA